MSYDAQLVSVKPGEKAPEPSHSDEFYCHMEEVKKKGRRKKDDPIDYRLVYVPWSDINDTELVMLTTYGLEEGSKEEMTRWSVASRGLRRIDLIGIIRGIVDPEGLPRNPTHVARERMARLFHSNWKFIHTQVRCNTLCWECPDAKPLECVMENRELLRGE